MQAYQRTLDSGFASREAAVNSRDASARSSAARSSRPSVSLPAPTAPSAQPSSEPMARVRQAAVALASACDAFGEAQPQDAHAASAVPLAAVGPMPGAATSTREAMPVVALASGAPDPCISATAQPQLASSDAGPANVQYQYTYAHKANSRKRWLAKRNGRPLKHPFQTDNCGHIITYDKNNRGPGGADRNQS